MTETKPAKPMHPVTALAVLAVVVGLFMSWLFTPAPVPVKPPVLTAAEQWNAEAKKLGREYERRELRDAMTEQRKAIFWHCILNAEGMQEYCFKKAGL